MVKSLVVFLVIIDLNGIVWVNGQCVTPENLVGKLKSIIIQAVHLGRDGRKTGIFV